MEILLIHMFTTLITVILVGGLILLTIRAICFIKDNI
jgi:hypothetical protein